MPDYLDDAIDRLVLEIVAQAVKDAQGNPGGQAAQWLMETGVEWLDILGVPCILADLERRINGSGAARE